MCKQNNKRLAKYLHAKMPIKTQKQKSVDNIGKNQAKVCTPKRNMKGFKKSESIWERGGDISK